MALPVSLAPKTVRPIPKRNLAVAAAGGGGGSGSASAPSIEQQAQGEIDPIIAALTGQAGQQAQAAAAAIQGLTTSYGQQLAGIDYGAPYSSAESQQAAVDAALQGSLSGQGASLAQALASQLGPAVGASGQGAVQQYANQAQTQGAGAGNAQLANGSAALSQLISDAAAASEYGSKVPGIVALSGLQGVQQAEGNAQSEIAQGTLQAESQLPTIMQQLRANKLSAESIASTNAYRNAEIAAKDAALNLTAGKDRATIQQGYDRLGIEQQNANTSVARLNLESEKAVQSSQESWARIGIDNKKLQLEIAKQNITTRLNGLSPSEASRYTSIADSWAQRMTGTSVDPTTGKTEPSLSFKDAMTQALKEGVPLSIAFPQFIKVAKSAGATPAQIGQLQKEYAPLDSAIRQAAAKVGPGMMTGLAGAVGSAMRPLATMGARANTIASMAQKMGLDPRAVLSVSMQEGLGGGIGDNGTSFGPFQMHVGGAFPQHIWEMVGHDPQLASRWAWSPQGIQYALSQIAGVAKGLKGQQAVEAIVRRFERPLNPNREAADAVAAYGG